MDAKKFGAFIAEVRKEKKMTQADLAEILKVTDKAVSKWERGVGFPDINTIEPLAEALGLSILELMKSERISQSNISHEEVSEVLSDTFQIMDSQEKVERNIMAIFLGCSMAFLLLLLLTSNAEAWLGRFVLLASLVVGSVSVFLYRKSIENSSGKKVYRVMLTLSMMAAAASGIYLLPDAFVAEYGEWMLFFVFLLAIIGNVTGIIRTVIKRDTMKTGRFLFLAAGKLIVILILGFGVHKQMERIQSAGQENRVHVVQQYAEVLLERDCAVKEEWINGRFCVSSADENAEEGEQSFCAVFTYCIPGEDEEKVYGYEVTIDRNMMMNVLEQGEDTGARYLSDNT